MVGAGKLLMIRDGLDSGPNDSRARGSFVRFLTELPHLRQLHLSGENLLDESLDSLKDLQ